MARDQSQLHISLCFDTDRNYIREKTSSKRMNNCVTNFWRAQLAVRRFRCWKDGISIAMLHQENDNELFLE